MDRIGSGASNGAAFAAEQPILPVRTMGSGFACGIAPDGIPAPATASGRTDASRPCAHQCGADGGGAQRPARPERRGGAAHVALREHQVARGLVLHAQVELRVRLGAVVRHAARRRRAGAAAVGVAEAPDADAEVFAAAAEHVAVVEGEAHRRQRPSVREERRREAFTKVEKLKPICAQTLDLTPEMLTLSAPLLQA